MNDDERDDERDEEHAGAGHSADTVDSTEPPPPETLDSERSEREDEMVVADEPDDAFLAIPGPRDHYVIATMPDGRQTQVWCSRQNRDEFTREEAEETALHYAAKMRAAGVGGLHEIKYKARGIEEYVLEKNPPAEVKEEKKEVHAAISFAEDAHLAGNLASNERRGAAPLPPGAVLRSILGDDPPILEEDVEPSDDEPS